LVLVCIIGHFVERFFPAKQLTDVLEVNAVNQQQESQTAIIMQRFRNVVERSNNLKQSLRRQRTTQGLSHSGYKCQDRPA